MAETNATRGCAHCGDPIIPTLKLDGEPSKARRRYCGAKCVWSAADVRRGPRERSGKRSVHKAICAVCEREFESYASGSSTGGWTKNCSVACGREGRYRRARKASAVRALIATEVRALKRMAAYVERPSVFRVNCTTCGCMVIARRCAGLHRKVCADCKRASNARCARKSKAKRRAVERGAKADNIDPLRVLARDNWRCQSCGISTPQKLRGTHDPRAPELDHIQTLAEGGSHTWSNLQCLCRSCNQLKGSKSAGQLHLAIAA